MTQWSYRIAKDLGIVDVEGMMERMTAKQLFGWIEFYAWERKQQSHGVSRSHEQTPAEMLRALGG